MFNRPGKAKTKQGQDKSQKGSALKNFKATFTPLPWNITGFEKGVLSRCAALLPEFQPWVANVKRRIVDPHLPFKRFDYYDLSQRGSTSIKAVMPPLTGLGYDELEIQEGSAASQEYLRVTFSDVTNEERQRVRRQLEDYCGRDTEGMVWIVQVLREAVGF